MRHFGDAIDWFEDARAIAHQKKRELEQLNQRSDGQRDELRGLITATENIGQARAAFSDMKRQAAGMRSMLNERASLLRHSFWSDCKMFGKKLKSIYQSFDSVNYIQIKFESVDVERAKANRLESIAVGLCIAATLISGPLEIGAKLLKSTDSNQIVYVQSESTLSRGPPQMRYGGDGGPPPDFDHEANAEAISGLVKGLSKILNSLFTKASVKRLIEVDKRVSVEGREFARRMSRKGKGS